MKTAKLSTGSYIVTGYTAAGNLVQYEINKNSSGWAVERICGTGSALHTLYSTKAEAVKAIENQ